MAKAELRCPECRKSQEVEIPLEKCLPFYKCNSCQKIISAPKDICCVICAYSDKKCALAEQKK